MSTQYDYLTSENITDIFAGQATKLFGELLGLLCEKANISQRRLGREAVALRKSLVAKGYAYVAHKKAGAMDQSGVSRVINGLHDPTYAQAYIWLRILRDIFNSDEYLQNCKKAEVEPYVFDEDFEVDMWRLALFGTPREVVVAYEKRKDMVNKQST